MSKLKVNYWGPTPVRLRKLGDALLAAGTTVTGYAIMEEEKIIAIISLALAVTGKFLTNLFSDERDNTDTGTD